MANLAHKVEVAPTEAHVLSCKSISGANWIVSCNGILARFLIDLDSHQVEIEIALHDALLQLLVQSWSPVTHVQLADQFAKLELVCIAHP